MPSYDYKCKEHGIFNVKIPLSDVSFPVTCPDCGQDMSKIFHPVAVSFKGGGFYRTDNRK